MWAVINNFLNFPKFVSDYVYFFAHVNVVMVHVDLDVIILLIDIIIRKNNLHLGGRVCFNEAGGWLPF